MVDHRNRENRSVSGDVIVVACRVFNYSDWEEAQNKLIEIKAYFARW